MPERVILHMGMHKTGTSALQRAFCKHSVHLASEGILFPGTDGADGHHYVPTAIREGNMLPLRTLVEETRDAKAVFLSSELFSCLTRSEYEVVRRLFPGARIEVAIVLRRLATLWPSHWRELIKHGYDRPFHSYLSEVLALTDVSLSTPVRTWRMLRDLEKVFGRDSLKLLVYEARNHDAGYGPSFARDVLRLDRPEAIATWRVNETRQDWIIETCRIFNWFGRSWIKHTGRKAILRAFIGKLSYQTPDWTRKFRTLLETSEPLVLTDESPVVAREQARVVADYQDRFVDPPSDYLAPSTSEVRCLSVPDLPDDLEQYMRHDFRLIRERLKIGPDRTTPAHMLAKSA